VLKVKDTGAGIPADQLPYIFDRFFQADVSSTCHAEGTGMGLALARELVKFLSGEIIAKSPPPGAKTGSEFTVTLPVSATLVAAPPPDRPLYFFSRQEQRQTPAIPRFRRPMPPVRHRSSSSSRTTPRDLPLRLPARLPPVDRPKRPTGL